MSIGGPVFLDTSVLLAGLIEVNGRDAPAQKILDSIVDRQIQHAHTAWHCCLEFFSISTQLPAEFRVTPDQAFMLIEQVVLKHFRVHSLANDGFHDLLRQSASERVSGGSIYDRHVGAVAVSSGAKILVTDNPLHFGPLSRRGIRVIRSGEFVAEALV